MLRLYDNVIQNEIDCWRRADVNEPSQCAYFFSFELGKRQSMRESDTRTTHVNWAKDLEISRLQRGASRSARKRCSAKDKVAILLERMDAEVVLLGLDLEIDDRNRAPNLSIVNVI